MARNLVSYLLVSFLSILAVGAKPRRMPRVDTHVHIIPPSYKVAIDKYGDPSGWATPNWTLPGAVSAADQLGVSVSIVSITARGPGIHGPNAEGRALARKCNDEVKDLIAQHPGRFAMFGALPHWEDVQGTLDEIDYVFGFLKAPGVVVMTAYGDKLIGDDAFKPIWDKLDWYAAVVFVHPTAVDITPKRIMTMPQPVIDYPQATTRAAASLIVSRTITAERKFKIILSHAGGTTPFLIDRLGFGGVTAGNYSMSMDDVLAAFKLLYFDLALSTHYTALTALTQLTTPDKILYGSDYPYAPLAEGLRQTTRLDEMFKRREFKALQSRVNYQNADKLFAGFGGVQGVLDRLGVGNKGKL